MARSIARRALARVSCRCFYAFEFTRREILRQNGECSEKRYFRAEISFRKV